MAFTSSATAQLLLICAEAAEEALLDQLDAILAQSPDAEIGLSLWPLSDPCTPDLDLLAAAQVLLCLQAMPPAQWVLAAQASQRRVIALGQAHYLERPWCLHLRDCEPATLAWYLRQALNEPAETLIQVQQGMARDHDTSQMQGHLPRRWTEGLKIEN
ncbi:MAG: hypothetical protein CVV27_17560 [Candidatus Melainabacteria bacterium HGW-Melainabacteria-1]|nr:MAG: hypothetical protein CVV27_17560 [Candidatus Melainabacteria bacterium HGW-Melainabacteria-1]